MLWFTALIVAVGLERLAELVVSVRNAKWSFAHGGKEYGTGHYLPMVVLHTGLLAGAVAEVWIADRPFTSPIGWAMLVLVLGSQGLRWWCIKTLGHHWNTRVIVVPGMKLVASGPYRWFRHPNYVAVVVEGFALPLVHNAWITAAVFSVLNLFLLRTRIKVEETALIKAAAAPGSA